MKNYRVEFFFKKRKFDGDEVVSEELKPLGKVTINDHGLDNGLTIIGKAFRFANVTCLEANSYTITEV